MSPQKAPHLSLFAAFFFAVLAVFAPVGAQAQGVNFTVQLTGSGANLGRLFIMRDDNGSMTSLGECPFQLDSSSLDLSPLSAEQLTCVFKNLQPGTKVAVFALKYLVSGNEQSGFSEVSFNSFDGVCSGEGSGFVNQYDLPLYQCEFVVGANDTSLSVAFDSPQVENFVEDSLGDVAGSVQQFGISKFLKKGFLKLSFPPSPQGGMMKIILTAKYKIKRRNGAFMVPAYGNIILAAGKALLSQTENTNMRFAMTRKGKNFMKGKKQVRATLQASWSQTGASAAAVSQLKTLLMRRR